MNFDLSEDQLALRDGIRALVEGRFPIERVREGFDREMYRELADAGVFSLQLDGFTWADVAVVYEELGRGAVPGPLVACFGRERIATAFDATVPGAPLVEHLGAVDDILVLGDGTVTRVDVSTVAVGDPAGWPLDPLTPVWEVDGIAHAGGKEEPVGGRRGEWAVLTSAFCVGMADRLTEMSVAYAMERRQFDRPIGSFQAIKHLCADMAVRTELARVATHSAACVLDDPEVGDIDRAVSTAKLLAGEAAVLNGRSATQVYGGMGFTWEVDVHLYLKRAWVLETHFGGGDHHADVVAAQLPSAS
jgi:alkylation response protein AidB-like acyl-CoA dehydrogenase